MIKNKFNLIYVCVWELNCPFIVRLLWGYPEEDENATHKHYPFGIEF